MRLFTVALLMMVSMAAGAQYVTVNIEKDGDFGNGSITEKKDAQTKSADGNIVTVTLIVKPKSGYSIDLSAIEVYETISPQTVYPNGTRANDVTLGKRLDVKCDVKTITKETECTIDVASNLGVWVQKAEFLSGSKGNRAVAISSGYYYLENKQNTDGGYFLVPAGGTGTVKYFNGNENTPYLTSYKKSAETEIDKINNFIWYIEKVTDGDNNTYYRFRHLLTGKYVVANGVVDTKNPARLRLHLETQQEPDENTLFVIEENTDNTISIRHKSVYATHTDGNQYWWWDVAGGNKDSYSQGDYNGLLCFWNVKNSDKRTKWAKPTAIETDKTVCLPPVISYDSETGKVTISSYEGYSDVTYYYTTDGTEPTTSLTPYSEPFEMPSGQKVVKAIAKRGNFQNATVTTYNIEQCATPVITMESDGTYTVTCTTDGVTFYYTTDGTMPTTTSTSNTTGSISLPLDLDGEFLRVIAAKTGGDGSDASPAALYYIPQCEKPTIKNTNGTISMATTTEGATIRYRKDGKEVTSTTGDAYTASYPYTITQAAHTITARAFKAGYRRSAQASLEYKKLNTPAITGVNNDGSLTLTPTGATFRYTTTNSTSSLPSDPGSGQPELVPSNTIVLPAGTDLTVVKVRGYKLGNGYSDVLTYYVPACDIPSISESGGTVTITGMEGATIYYSTSYDGDFTEYSSSFSKGDATVIRAYASKTGYRNSQTAYLQDAIEVSSTSAITNMAGNYKLAAVFTVNGQIGTSEAPFTGTIDGQWNTISSVSAPLVAFAKNATIKNITIAKVNISSGTNVGAICGEATGATKIYNCGVLDGSVSGTGSVGGLVGKVGDYTRVVNCYNYATVNGGEYVGGVVGQNAGLVTPYQTEDQVRIAMCMMYGDMTEGTNRSPVYAGNHRSNKQEFTEYNYYLYSTEKDADGKRIEKIRYTAYNDQMAIDKEDYLTRFPFYRYILNTHRELASYFLFGDYTSDHIAEIGHWVLDKSKANYPIVERWNTNTKKVLDAPAGSTVSVRKGEGDAITSINVTVKIGNNTYTTYPGTNTALTLPITGMDEANFDYTWGKVVLPFANEFEVNTDYTQICTGWKITDITGGTTGSSFSKYDVSDRDCTSKDKYTTTGFIFAQGGNYIVPYNVTAIEITANFATAYYLSDESYDIGYSGDKSNSGYGGRMSLGGSTPTKYHGKDVYNTLAAALSAMTNSGTTHDQAVVLVGNYHQDDEDLSSHTAKGLTIMSIDADNNQEPDYAWYSNNTQDRPAIPPTRFDFVALIPVGMSSRVNNSTFYPGIPIWKPRGWFEMTETSLSKMDQFELNSNNFNTSSSDTRNYRCIINGGYFTQMVRSRKAACNKVKYYQIGGKAYVKEFYPGSHSADNYATTLCPINVTGGEIEQCFMTGFGKGTAIGSDIYFWCAGGKIDKFLGAYMEKPRQTSSSDGTVNMTAKIDHAKIGRFFGGGTSPKAPITGNIDVTINNSHVDFYCGGPEFGSMSAGKTVSTQATNTVFEEYYGAGFGGTAISYTNDKDDNNQGLGSTSKPTVTYPSSFFTSCYCGSTVGRLKYKSGYGIGSCYKMEFIFNSRGAGSVARFYTGYAQFDLATTGSVTNELTGCTINGDFYGAGCQGKVSGTVTSTLTNCTVNGSAFGGGFKAKSNEVEVYTAATPSLSTYTRETGIFSDFGEGTYETYNWAQGNATTENTVNGTTLYTSKDITISDLGNVTGAITLTIDGGTVGAENDTNTNHGNVYGGGNESKSLNNTTVTLKGSAHIYGNVFGGGNKGHVQGSTEVNIQN